MDDGTKPGKKVHNEIMKLLGGDTIR